MKRNMKNKKYYEDKILKYVKKYKKFRNNKKI